MITIPGTPAAIRNRLNAVLRIVGVHLNKADIAQVLAALQEPLEYTQQQLSVAIRAERAERIAEGPAGRLADTMKELTP